MAKSGDFVIGCRKDYAQYAFEVPKFYSTYMINRIILKYAIKNMAKIQAPLKYRLPHTVGKLRLSSFSLAAELGVGVGALHQEDGQL